MIKRSPQEIADFFGCYVAQDNNGHWFVYQEEPTIKDTKWENLYSAVASIGIAFVDIPNNHDWTKLYSPNVSENPTGSTVSKMENVVGISEKETTREDSAKIAQAKDRYAVAYGDCIEGLTGSVNAYLSEGYLLAENLVVDNGEFYQPMIKYN